MTIVSQKDLFPKNIDRFLKTFRKLIDVNIKKGIKVNFEIESRSKKQKFSPMIKLAELEDAKDIVEICKDVYEGTYPYKEMEDEDSIRDMILSSNYHIVLFKDMENNSIGCFKCILDFKKKKAYMGGFMIKRAYQGKVDIVKAIIGSYMWMWSAFNDKISLWYCENRTAHATSQYITSVCGVKTVAILPNKDIFFHKIESDVFGIIYNEKILEKNRCKDIPKIIPEINNCFLYANKKFNLGPVEFRYPSLNLNPFKIKLIKQNMNIKITEDKIGYRTISFSIEKGNSYFTFVYTPWLQNFEKTRYEVSSLEELIVFLNEFKRFAKELNVRYVEVLVSAYQPGHQRIFYDAGLTPRGYIPCWEYNKKSGYFEDFIMFNHFTGEIKDIILLPEGLELLEFLELDIPY